MPANLEGDVSFLPVPDGGEITYIAGQPVMSTTLEVAMYLSMFGGNAADDGTKATKHLQYWGNFLETDDARRLTSRTQTFLLGTPNTLRNLNSLKAVILEDLNWMLEKSIVSSLVITLSIPERNRVKIEIDATAEGQQQLFTFTSNWQSLTR